MSLPDLPHLGGLVFGTPLMIARPKLDTILQVLSFRLQGDAPDPGIPAGDRPFVVTPNGIAVIPVLGTLANWGRAVNAVHLVETYRTAGPSAALAELATLAAPAAPKDGGGGSVPPGAAAAALLLTVVLTGTVACAPLSAKIDQATGTTLEQRCKVYRAGEATAATLATSFPELAGLAAVDEAAVKALCDQPAPAAP